MTSLTDRLSPPARMAVPLRIGVVSTYPPTRCGIARFSRNLVTEMGRLGGGVELQVIRVVEESAVQSAGAPVSVEVDLNSRVGIRAAARALDGTDVVMVQHEYGIFGRNDGEAVIELIEQVQRPVVAVLHTVLSEPGPNQRRIIEHLHRQSQLVVMCDTARAVLESRYGIPRRQVALIRHGSHWGSQPANPPPRRRLITWGLLGPGKGLERSIEAIARLRDSGLDLSYLIVGRTHPAVLRRDGPAYRQGLQRLVSSLRLDDLVRFEDRYVEDDELLSLVRRSDLVLVPYDNDEQMTSGVVTDGLAAGRPVVATRFPYAVEMVGRGSGATVGHDAGELAEAIRSLLVDEQRYSEAAAGARRWSPVLSWRAVAERYIDLMRHAAAEKATA